MGIMEPVKKEDLEGLFARVDARIDKKIDIFVIGGAAAIVGYGIQKFTQDVDLDNSVDPQLDEIFKSEARAMGFELYLSSKGVFFPPDGYRSRMKFLDFPKRNLRVYYLDKYDLAISKIDRGIQKDMDDIVAVHEKSPFELEELINIFSKEYITVAAVGDPRGKMMNLLDVISRLFGDEAMNVAKVKIGFTDRS